MKRNNSSVAAQEMENPPCSFEAQKPTLEKKSAQLLCGQLSGCAGRSGDATRAVPSPS